MLLVFPDPVEVAAFAGDEVHTLLQGDLEGDPREGELRLQRFPAHLQVRIIPAQADPLDEVNDI